MRRPGRQVGRRVAVPACRCVRATAPLLHDRGLHDRGLHDRGREAGSATVEFALLTTLVAGITFGIAAVVGAQVEQPLETITTVLTSLISSNG